MIPPSLWLSRVSFFLANGSTLLLFGGIAFERSAFVGGACFLFFAAWPGAAVHALGWYQLYAAGFVAPQGRVMNFVGAMVFAFLSGIVALAISVPRGWELLFFALPYIPFVFGPVVFVQARLFLAFSEELPSDRARDLIRLGSHVLVGLAGLGIVGQAGQLLAGFEALDRVFGADGQRLVTFWTFVPYPAGLTALGYALVWWGWSTVAARTRADQLAAAPAQGTV